MRLKTHADDLPVINLTPMLDVVFNLIVFFMVGTQFADMERRMDVNVPTVKPTGAMSPAPSKQVVNIGRDGACTLNGKELTVDQLERSLADVKRQFPDVGVVVRGDGKCQFESVAEVLAACSRAKIADTAIAVKVGGKVR